MIHKFLFWVAIGILQLEDQRLYSAGLALLEQNLLTLDTHGVFDTEVSLSLLSLRSSPSAPLPPLLSLRSSPSAPHHSVIMLI